MALEPNFIRGAFLLKDLEKMLAEIDALPDSSRKSLEKQRVSALAGKLEYKLFSTPRGFVAKAFQDIHHGEKLDYGPAPVDERYREVLRLLTSYGTPEGFNRPINDDVAIDLLDSALRDAECWEYLKRICHDRLTSGCELHPLLLRFSGAALYFSIPKTRRGRTKASNHQRNGFFAYLARLLQTHFHLPLSRNPTSQNDSVCSIIAETLEHFPPNMSEDAIRKAIEQGILDGKKSGGFVSGD